MEILASGKSAMNQPSIRVVFFDLGDTLVRAASTTPAGTQFDWVAGAKDMLQVLGQSGLRLGILSNTGSLTRNQLAARLPSDFNFGLFDETLILLSSEIGLQKPDARIFRLAINRAQQLPDPARNLQFDAWNCLFCGESLSECLVAQRVGMTAARINLRPSPEISNLANQLRAAGLIS